MKHVFDNSGFKKFLLSEEGRFKEDGLSVWFNTIPIPLDLFDSFFDEWRMFFQIYLDHLMASLILSENIQTLERKNIKFKELPGAISQVSDDIIEILISNINNEDKYKKVAGNISGVLGIRNYALDAGNLIKPLYHKGKKYERLFLPEKIKTEIKKEFPFTLSHIGIKNGDMFGNVIADQIGLYRAGFGDALSSMFNKLLEYKIEKCSGNINKESSVSLNFNENQEKDLDESFILARTKNNCLWEPFFDGDVKFKLNPNHLFCNEAIDGCNKQIVLNILLKISEMEFYSSTTKEMEFFEEFRLNLSRKLSP